MRPLGFVNILNFPVSSLSQARKIPKTAANSSFSNLWRIMTGSFSLSTPRADQISLQVIRLNKEWSTCSELSAPNPGAEQLEQGN